MAIVVEPYDAEGLDAELLLREPQLLALPTGHPLAWRPRPPPGGTARPDVDRLAPITAPARTVTARAVDEAHGRGLPPWRA